MRRISASKGARRLLPLAVFALVIAYLVFNATYGNRGMLALDAVGRQVAMHKVELTDLSDQRQVLEHRVGLLGGGDNYLDTDILEEEARRVLGWSRADEVIVLRQGD